MGEALLCEHAHDEPHGCGTTRFCRNCGTARATVRCVETNRSGADECRIARDPHLALPALDLLVWTTPLEIRGEGFVIFAVRDMADEKRRAVLERIFFHDVLNAAGGLQGLIALLHASSASERGELIDMAQQLSAQLVEEIEAQRDLAAAERGELRSDFREIDAEDLLGRVRSACVGHPAAVGKQVVVDEIAGKTRFDSDEVVLRRVLGNLLKNALEASLEGGTVRIGFRNVDRPCFRVHNATAMPDAVRDQIFQRSFTTKPGSGRGVGTYSIKLLTERHLRGTVSFTTSPAAGTTFLIELPGGVVAGPTALGPGKPPAGPPPCKREDG
jgi:signal transduction histidine kinase